MNNIRVYPPCRRCKGSLSAPKCPKSLGCGHCQSYTMPIPSVSFLLDYFPDVTPNMSIDRGTEEKPILACKICALVSASKKAMDAEAHSKTADKKNYIERRITTLESDINTRINTDDDYAMLHLQMTLMPVLKRELSELKTEIDRNVEKAWLEYWGVWGNGPYEVVQDRRPSLGL